MDDADLEVLREAVERRQRKEPLERAVSRAVRRRGLDYAFYIGLMSRLREYASERKLDADSALDELARADDE